jgi:2-dehydro-3-deoxyphosphogluconate aldolase/(4S)-4-hydroxy-2-oxoglutarate aldolase
MNAREVLSVSPIVPVITIENEDHAVPLAQALIAGGIKVMEITLRTEAGIPSIEKVAQAIPDMVVGAGTVLNPTQFDAVCDAGAKFAISPGFTSNLLEYTAHSTIPLIPGVGSASEIMRAMEEGFDTFKLFPANIVGGVGALKAFGGPFGDIKFCPTGGVNLDNLNDYLSLGNVLCVGGTWIAPKNLIATEQFETITTYCKEALQNIN